MTRPTDANGIPIISLAARLATEARSRRGRYIGSVLDLARWTASNPHPEAVAVMLAEVAALDNGLQAVRDLLS